MSSTILDTWQITAEELMIIIENNPSLRGMLMRYVAEKKIEGLFLDLPGISRIGKTDVHDRARKGDRNLHYKNTELIIEVKSLLSNSIRRREDGSWCGRAQVDAGDRRTVTLPSGEEVTTTCLVVGEFDVLAVNLFAFEEKWRFAFARNQDLPRSRWKKYTKKQQKYLLATQVEVTWPPEPPFYEDPFPLLDEIARERTKR